MKKGIFFTFEGPDGSGKSTMAKYLYDFLKVMGVDVFLTKQPGGSELGSKIREVVLTNKASPLTQMLLFSADRNHHLETVIRPKLNEGTIVICDRYVLSTMAYQGIDDKMRKNITDITGMIVRETDVPDYTFIVTASDEILDSRLVKRNDSLDVMENETKEFIARTRQYFNKVVTDDSKDKRIIHLDSNKSLQYLMDQVSTWVTHEFLTKEQLQKARIKLDEHALNKVDH